MDILTYEKKTEMPCSAEHLFRWHEQPDAFPRLMPPREPVTVLQHDGHVRDGARARLQVGYPPFRFLWELEHRDYLPGRQFCDVQIKGPFTYYRHEHRMVPIGANRSVLHDHIRFALPLGMAGRLLGKWIMMSKFERLFSYRHEVTRKAVA